LTDSQVELQNCEIVSLLVYKYKFQNFIASGFSTPYPMAMLTKVAIE